MNPEPPYFILITEPVSFLEALHVSEVSEQGIEVIRLVSRGLPPVTSINSLSVLLGVTPSTVAFIVQRSSTLYRHFTVRQGKKDRTMSSPLPSLMSMQRWFAYYLSSGLAFPDHVYGFVRDRNSIQAARLHVGCDWLWSTDLKNFFGSTNREKVKFGLQDIGYSEKSAELICEFAVLDGTLPQGSPSSPILSNVAFLALDRRLSEFVSRYPGIQLTRYADDIVLSGNGKPNYEVIEGLQRLIEADGWSLSHEKTSLQVGQTSKRVLGLLVTSDALRLRKKQRNLNRAYKHILKHYSNFLDNENKINACLGYYKAVESSD